MRSDTKRMLAVAIAGLGCATAVRGQMYDPNNSFVYLSANLPDGSNAQESAGGQSALVPMSVGDSGLITGYYRAYQYAGQDTGYGYSTGIVLATSSTVAAPNTTVTSFTQITGAGSPDGNPNDLPSSSGYGSGNGNNNYGFGINSAGTVADTNNYDSGEWASIAVPSANASFGTYTSTVIITVASSIAGGGSDNGTFGGGNFFSPPSGLGTAINNAGDVVGGAFAAPFNSKKMHALIQPVGGGDPIDLNQYVPGSVSSMAYGVDPAGNTSTGNATVVGVSSPYTGTGVSAAKLEKSATVWTETNGTWSSTLLPSLYTLHPNSTSEGQSVAYGVATVNGNQEVVGLSDGPTGFPVATLWTNGVPTNLDGVNNGSHETLISPYALDFESTNVKQEANPKDDYSNGTNNIQSVADAINSSGDIVGYTTIINNSFENQTAVLWTPSGTEINLNNYIPASISAEYPGAYLEEATGINSSGQIVGWGQDTQADIFGFELNPIAVPEPTGVVLVAAAVGLLQRRRRTVLA